MEAAFHYWLCSPPQNINLGFTIMYFKVTYWSWKAKLFLLTFLQIDLVPPEVVTAWKHYYSTKFEELNVVCFTSFPKDESERKREPGKGTPI